VTHPCKNDCDDATLDLINQEQDVGLCPSGSTPPPTPTPTPPNVDTGVCGDFNFGAKSLSSLSVAAFSAGVRTTTGLQCQFPFTYIDPTTNAETKFTSCTTKGDPDGKAWCSTKTTVDSRGGGAAKIYHVAGNWGYCPQAGVAARNTAWESLTETWKSVNSKNGPPACLNDCQGINTVTDQDSLACFSKCALTQSCISDCDQETINLLNSVQAECSAGGAPPPTPAPVQDTPLSEQCTAFVGSSSAASGSSFNWFSSRRLDIWNDVGAKSGPPACLNDCPGIGTVTDQPSLACFASCAVTHPCKNDCDDATLDLLNSKKDQCGASTAPIDSGTRSVAIVSDLNAADVAVLPSCLSKCNGFAAVLRATLNCQSLKQWAGITLIASCSSACRADDLRGLQSLSARSCDGSLHM